MCGIIGFAGRRDCAGLLLSGLSALEYRGYDSAGIAVQSQGDLQVRRSTGRLKNLQEMVSRAPLGGSVGIGHTRWATHGRPSEENCHPHIGQKGRIAVVHNGIIENYAALKRSLMERGVQFSSQTDTEVIAQLLEYYYEDDLLTTLGKVLPMLEGSYALGILDVSDPDTVWCARRGSPLIVGKGQGENYLASDISAVLEYTRDVYILDDGEIAALSADEIRFYGPQGQALEKEATPISWSADSAKRGGFAHFMLKEIYDQPQAIEDTLNHYIDAQSLTIRRESMPFTREQAQQVENITIVACGTAYHAGMVGQNLLEQLAKVRTHAQIASEYRYQDTVYSANETLIAVSQSGETADTIAAVRKAKNNGHRIVALSNVLGSTVAREAHAVMYTLAGPEIAVASTKAYTTQVLLFEILALDLGNLRGLISERELQDYLRELLRLPDQVRGVLERAGQVEHFAHSMRMCRDVFFIGRQLDYCTSLEAALKLKEISYIHSEAYAAGELKHGTIALIDETTLVVATATQERIFLKTLSNVEEVRARGASILLITDKEVQSEGQFQDIWPVPGMRDIYSPIPATVYVQLFAYYMALQKGCDIDKPRNLAKSVTVE